MAAEDAVAPQGPIATGPSRGVRGGKWALEKVADDHVLIKICSIIPRAGLRVCNVACTRRRNPIGSLEMVLPRLAVVTGANKGIGRAIATALAALDAPTDRPPFHVLLCARQLGEGLAACDDVRKAHPHARVSAAQLDITEEKDVAALVQAIRERHGGAVDVLINNAGMAYKGDTFGLEEARETIAVNFGGTRRVTEALLPLLRAAAAARGEARIINVASSAGRLCIVKPPLGVRFSAPSATVAQVVALCDEFLAAVADGVPAVEERGWPRSMYGVSKLAEIAYTFILARELERERIIVNAVCPGYCATAMCSFKGPRSPEQGAETPVWLATRSGTVGDLTGGFYADHALVSW